MMATANPFEVKEDKEEKEELPIQARSYACTLVTLLPYELLEEKPHLLPGSFRIPAAEWGDIAILHVEEGVHYVPNPLVDDGKPGSSIKQVTTPREMARSLCDDYNCAHVATDDDANPSLFWVEGRLTKDEVKKYHKDKINNARAKVKQWFHNLCAMADTDWNRNRNRLSVSDLQRTAAKSLGIKKEWVEFIVEETITCKFCTFAVPPNAVVCPNCKQVLNQDKFKQLGGQ
jgi:hypothetical protein